MSHYDQLTRDRLLRAKKEPLKLRAFGRTGPLRCFARYDGGWHVHIGETPSCTCPDFQCRHRPCKHIMKTILCILGGATDMAVQSTLTDKQLTTLFQPNSGSKAVTKPKNRKKRKAVSSPAAEKHAKKTGGSAEHVCTFPTCYIGKCVLGGFDHRNEAHLRASKVGFKV